MPEGGNTPEGEISDQSPRNNKLRELGKRFGQKVKQIAYKKGNLVSNTPGPIPEPTPTTTPDPFDNIRILPPPPETLTLPPQFQIDNSQNLPMPEPLPAAFPENPADMLDYLIAHNQQFDYSENKFTPEQIAHAVSFAKSKGWNLNELSPAQISSAQMFAIGDLTLAELAEDTTEKRTERLITHKDSHREILLPEKPTYFHATAAKETVDDIYRTGLYCDINTGLGGVAAPLERKSHIENNLLDEQVIANNLKILSHPHRGYPYEVIIELPDLTEEQKADYAARKRNGEDVNLTSYFITRLSEPIGIPGVEITYNAILPSKYIKGYLDTTTGIFHHKPTLNQS